jgi:hypothetical protein
MKKLNNCLLTFLAIYYSVLLAIGLYLFFKGGPSPLQSWSTTEVLAFEFGPLFFAILVDMSADAFVAYRNRTR